MPIIVKSFNAAEQITADLVPQLEYLYDTSPEFADGKAALIALKTALGRGDMLYVAEFNDKIIAAIWSRGIGDTRTLQYVVTHHANRGRGIALRLIEQVCHIEADKGVEHFEPGCGAIRRILAQLEHV